MLNVLYVYYYRKHDFADIRLREHLTSIEVVHPTIMNVILEQVSLLSSLKVLIYDVPRAMYKQLYSDCHLS